jgi:hypothetical protein
VGSQVESTGCPYNSTETKIKVVHSLRKTVIIITIYNMDYFAAMSRVNMRMKVDDVSVRVVLLTYG